LENVDKFKELIMTHEFNEDFIYLSRVESQLLVTW